MISLDSFLTLKKLTVNNIQVDSRRVKADYSVENFHGKSFTTQLMYSYDSSMFDKKKPEDINLASMMLAQVAFNYGLFFKTIEFDGLFDKLDIKFIENMLENTSKEILINKLCLPNKFLSPEFCGLQPIKKKRYTQSKLIFSNSKFPEFQKVPLKKYLNSPNSEKFIILSSGGKDSLLTYGMIKEFAEPYPVFINEAGRHWFTSLNAYRFLKKTEANTTKVWCNSDRVFTWMLHKLPFIKPNFLSIRSDDYPIRLWTVAVFIFGALPFSRKFGIGNILIGNEYDTTVMGRFQGISHYKGLYDQSRFFDNTLSQYYKKKGWQLNQISILRYLGELLIMKILLKRYPKLQKHQISCHAAHEIKGRMHPCGNCEKCRRIIGMIMALGEKPERCGYLKPQIKHGLSTLQNKSIKQSSDDASHLYYLLLKKKLIEKNKFTVRIAKKHSEIDKLRLDNMRSPLADLPPFLRKNVINIALKYVSGTVIKTKGFWLANSMKKQLK